MCTVQQQYKVLDSPRPGLLFGAPHSSRPTPSGLTLLRRHSTGATAGDNSGDTSPTGCSPTYRVRAGDTCQSLADAAGLDTWRFNLLNPALPCSEGLVEGQVVCLGPAGERIHIMPLYPVPHALCLPDFKNGRPPPFPSTRAPPTFCAPAAPRPMYCSTPLLDACLMTNMPFVPCIAPAPSRCRPTAPARRPGDAAVQACPPAEHQRHVRGPGHDTLHGPGQPAGP